MWKLVMSLCTIVITCYNRLQGELTGHACPYVPDIFFFSVILFFGTFVVAFALKKFKLTPYLSAKVTLSPAF